MGQGRPGRGDLAGSGLRRDRVGLREMMGAQCSFWHCQGSQSSQEGTHHTTAASGGQGWREPEEAHDPIRGTRRDFAEPRYMRQDMPSQTKAARDSAVAT